MLLASKSEAVKGTGTGRLYERLTALSDVVPTEQVLAFATAKAAGFVIKNVGHDRGSNSYHCSGRNSDGGAYRFPGVGSALTSDSTGRFSISKHDQCK